MLSVPANITAVATGPNGAFVGFSASAQDLVSGSIAVTCLPSPGSLFHIGTTNVGCSAVDGAGNAAAGSFDLTVVEPVRKIKLNTAAAPGVARPGGVSVILGSGFSSGGIAPSHVSVMLAATCGGTPIATTSARSVTMVSGSTRTVGFGLPTGVAAGPYQISISGLTDDGGSFGSLNCSSLTITQ